MRRALAVTAALLATVALAGCSSDSSSDAAASPGATAAASPIGGNVLPPVIVEWGQEEATAKVGDTIVFNVQEVVATTVDTDNPDILAISQARQEGDALFNPGAVALKAGKALVTITDPDNNPHYVVVTVTE